MARSHRQRGRSVRVLSLMAMLAAPFFSGCSADDGTGGQTTDFMSPSTDSDTGVGAGEFCMENQTRECTCGSLSGRQTCLGSAWSECECLTGIGGPDTGTDEPIAGNGDLDPGYDYVPEENRRDDVDFYWLKTEPSQGECKPGRYEGSFECTTNGPMGPGIMPEILVTGPVVMTLEESSNGEFLEIVDGSLEGVAQDFAVPFTSKLEGRLDCTTNKFEAHAVDGSYILFGLPGKFHGDLTGDYNRLTSHLAGEWSLGDDANMNLLCIGPWTADFVEP
jgi:hypothetical protein